MTATVGPPAEREGPGPAALTRILRTVADVLGPPVTPGDVAPDVDLFGEEPFVVGRRLDSLDLIEVLAAVEGVLGRSLEPLLAEPTGPVTLRDLSGADPRIGRPIGGTP